MDEGKRTVHPAIKVWFLIHCFLTFMWCIPFSAPVYNPIIHGEAVAPEVPRPSLMQWVFIGNDRYLHSGEAPLHNYFFYTGYWQYWDMFAPDPNPRDYYLDFVLTFGDGSTEVVEWPRIAQMGLVQKYFWERYRKFSERIRDPQKPFLWKPILEKIAADTYEKEHKMAARIVFREHYRILGNFGTTIPQSYEINPICDILIDGDHVKQVHGL